MVGRLASLEAEQSARQASLEADVRAASRELLARNRSLAQADRLAAVGEMAAGLAHELRNPLAGIQFALSNLRQELKDEDAQAHLDLVLAELRRMTELMNGLLNQARLVPEAPSRVPVVQTLAEVLVLARYQIAAAIHFEPDIAADLCCWLPENRLRQALLNLLLNAAQAMDNRGTIGVDVRHAEGRLAIRVGDEGPGFSEALLRGGVQPFATARLGGTGLGLASVRRFALDLGGSLDLENLAPHGARATLLLPCSSSKPKGDATR
jgi:signal transduction histidine kinase